MSSLMPILALLLGAGGMVLIYRSAASRPYAGGGMPRFGRRRILQERLIKKKKEEPVVVVDPAKEQAPRRTLLPYLTDLIQRTRAQPLMRQLEQALILARIPLKPAEFLYVAASSLFFAMLVVQFTTRNIVMSMLITLVAGFSPFYYLSITQRIRFGKIGYQVADSLLLMTNSLRAGASFMDAMDAAAREMPPPISDEFGRALRDISLGVPVDEAFVKMSVRCRSEDLDLAVTAFKIQREVGGNLAEILENIAATIRERVKLKQEIKTLSAQGKMSGFILCTLPLALTAFLHTMNPKYMTVLFTDPMGKMFVMVAVVMQIIGIFLISKIIKIDA